MKMIHPVNEKDSPEQEITAPAYLSSSRWTFCSSLRWSRVFPQKIGSKVSVALPRLQRRGSHPIPVSVSHVVADEIQNSGSDKLQTTSPNGVGRNATCSETHRS